MIGTFSSGSGSPARTRASRRSVSCGESAPTLMSLIASFALRNPRFPLCLSIIRWRSAKVQSGMSLSSKSARGTRTQLSPMATSSSTDSISAMSSQVRSGVVTDIPSTVVTSSL
ncbi:hypothetical protein D9M72_430410 [compost metagenome]